MYFYHEYIMYLDDLWKFVITTDLCGTQNRDVAYSARTYANFLFI